MRDPTGETIVFSSQFAVEINLVVETLACDGIRARIVNESASAFEPSLLAVEPLHVLVLTGEAERARTALQRMHVKAQQDS